MPVSLQYLQPLFVEERSLGAWTRNFLLGIIIVCTAFALIMLALIRYTGWHRMLSMPGGIVFLIGIFEVILFALIRMVRSIVIVEPQELQLRLSIGRVTLWQRRMAMRDIQSIRLMSEPVVGSALRFDLERVSFMTSKTNILIACHKGSKLLVGSNRIDQLLACLQDAIKPPAQPNSSPPHDRPSV